MFCFSSDEAMKILEVATPQDLDDLRPQFARKVHAALKNALPAKQEELRNRIEAAKKLFEPQG